MNNSIDGRKIKCCFFLDMSMNCRVLPIHLSFDYAYHIKCSLYRRTVELKYSLFFKNSLAPDSKIFGYASDCFHADINILFFKFVLNNNF